MAGVHCQAEVAEAPRSYRAAAGTRTALAVQTAICTAASSCNVLAGKDDYGCNADDYNTQLNVHALESHVVLSSVKVCLLDYKHSN